MKKKSIYLIPMLLLFGACNTPQKESDTVMEEDSKKEFLLSANVVEYSSDTTNMKGYIAFDKNDSSKRPGILVVHEWWGHNDHARERAEMLAKLGYVALAVDMYGDGKQAAHPSEAGEFASMVMGNMNEAKARFESAIETLKSNQYVDQDKIGAIGYCFGGSLVLSMANSGYDLDAVAAFHAGLRLPVMPDSGVVKSKILVANGGADPMINEQQVEDFKAVMDAGAVDYTYVSYDGAVHAYTNKEADKIVESFPQLKGALAYNAAADSASWEELKILFSKAF